MLARLRGLVPSCPQVVCKRPSNDAAVQARGQFTYSGLTTASSISRDQRKFSILAFSAFCCWRRSSLQISRIDRRVSQPRGEHCDLQRRRGTGHGRAVWRAGMAHISMVQPVDSSSRQ